MMNAVNWALGAAFIFGSIRALQLWRAQTRVEVVNVVVLSALGEGRGADIPGVLRSSGSALYLEVACRLVEPLASLDEADEAEVKNRLEREAVKALTVVNRRISGLWWLDTLSLIAIAFAGFSAFSGERPSLVQTLALLAATLLWLANVRGARSLSTRMYAGATALVEGIVKILGTLREADAHSTDRAH
jgi:hypothetical protein